MKACCSDVAFKNQHGGLKGFEGLLITSQGRFRNIVSLRIETGKWSVKVDRLEYIAHTDGADGGLGTRVRSLLATSGR